MTLTFMDFVPILRQLADDAINEHLAQARHDLTQLVNDEKCELQRNEGV